MANRRRIEVRDAGLERLSKLTQAVLCGGFVASGVVAMTAAHSFAGHSTASSPSVASDGSAAVVDSPSAGVQGDDETPAQVWGAQPAESQGGYVQSPSPSASASSNPSSSSDYYQVPVRRWHTVSRSS